MKPEDLLRAAIRKLHYSHRTEESYVIWYQQFVRFYELRHPETMGSAEVEAFLTHLAVNRNVSASTRIQTLNSQPTTLNSSHPLPHPPSAPSPSSAVPLPPPIRPSTSRPK